MSSRTERRSKTGKIKRSDLEPRLRREIERQKTLPEMPENRTGSKTGIMRIPPELKDDTAERDEDQPA